MTHVVVGGGLSGILSAVLLAESGKEVVVVERDATCGGLLRSYYNEEGRAFDFGTHFGRDTGLAELDEVLYGDIDESDWLRFQVVKTGNYFGGTLDESSLFIDANRLPREQYQRGVQEMMALDPLDTEPRDLDSYYRQNYGDTFTDHLLRPPLEKLFSCPAKDLSAGARHLFGLSRLRCFSPEMTRQLKHSPLFDERLAYHSFYEGQSGKWNYYPRAGGIGRWIDLLLARLERAGGVCKTGCAVEAIEHSEGKVSALQLSDGSRLTCEQLVWTIPPALCMRAAGVPVSTRPPQLLSTALLHYTVDRPFGTNLFYFVCYEPHYHAYRTTLYPNVGVDDPGPGPYQLTTEVVHRGDADVEALQRTVPDELRAMGVLAGDAKVLYQHAIDLKNCIPVMTPAFMEDSRSLVHDAQETFENVHFFGKAAGLSFFIHEVLIETYQRIREGL